MLFFVIFTVLARTVAFAAEPNTPPTIAITEPDGTNDAADISYTITWTNQDPDNDAKVSLYYDTDNTGKNGALIVEDLSENNETDSYTLDTSLIPEGNYYIYAVIDDGVNDPVATYSNGPITITHAILTCQDIKKKIGVWNVDCNNATKAGYYWKVENKLREYGFYGMQKSTIYHIM